eukprot:TRINITY_DN239_c0_g1_i1.p1 TRINITY_DN239_c0_g1~~TRINITY_DN239_c0_g1_i1.p1  ORF type:complete len:737 (+),score=104.08 TRINITY_DN239_c0_g1_i1:109-2319(+)
MDLLSLLTSLGTSFLIFVLLVTVYSILSRVQRNRVIYFPNKILKGHDDWKASKVPNPLSWIAEAWNATEADLISMAGLDATVYVIFVTTVLIIMLASGVICLPLLVPLSATDKAYAIEAQKAKAKHKNYTSYDDFDKLAMGNIQNGSARLWAFVLGAYWVSFVTYYLLWRTYRHVLALRAREQASFVAKPEQFVVLVRDIPPDPQGRTRKEQVDSFFRRIYPETFERSIIVTNMSEAEKAWKKLQDYKKKLARAETAFRKSKTTGNPEGTRPTMKTGFLGLFGKKVDSIDYLNDMIKKASAELETKQRVTLSDKQVGAAFIIFNSRPAAAAAAQTVHAMVADAWTVLPAPEPRQIIWKNLPISFYNRIVRQESVYVIVFLCIVFYMIPIAFVSGFTTLENLRKALPFLKWVVEKKALKTILEAYLPQLALILFLALLPAFMMFLSKIECIPAESDAVRAASGKYFYFTVFNVFIGVTLTGTLFASLKEILKTPSKIISILSRSLPPNATFFISFIALKFFVGYGLELSRVVPLLIFNIKKSFLCKTEEEVVEAWKPSGFGYATRVPNDLLIMTIALCYAVIAPMIIPFAVLYFVVGWFVARNQALNVCVPEYESNGRMWPHMHTRILGALFLSQLTMFGYFSLKSVSSPALIPLPFATLAFAFVCRKKFYPSFTAVSMEAACHDAKEVPSITAIVQAFTPPCLQTDQKFDDSEAYEDAQSTISSRAASLATPATTV